MNSREAFKARYAKFVAQPEGAPEVGPAASPALITGSAKLAWPTEGEERFRLQDVESLLDQSADLLDRGLRDRAEWYTLAERAFRVALEIKEFQRLEEITTKEIDSGRFTSIAAQSEAEWKALSSQETLFQKAKDVLSDLDNSHYSEQGMYWRIDHAAGLAIAGRNNEREMAGSNAKAAQNYDLRVSKQLNYFQSFNVDAQLQGATSRKTGAAAKKDYDALDITFQDDRRKLTSEIGELKILEAVRAGGAINFADRMDPLRERFLNDFGEALARIQVAARGLSMIYGYDAPLPSSTEDPQFFFDRCVIWVRNAITWLVALTRQDQRAVVTVSVRSLIGEDKWAQGIQECQFQVELSRENLQIPPFLRLIRVRGIACSFIPAAGTNEMDLVQITATQAETGQKCFAGRVAARQLLRDPDLVGADLLHNAPLIGTWTLTLPKFSLTQAAIQNVMQDLWLDLHFACQG